MPCRKSSHTLHGELQKLEKQWDGYATAAYVTLPFLGEEYVYPSSLHFSVDFPDAQSHEIRFPQYSWEMMAYHPRLLVRTGSHYDAGRVRHGENYWDEHLHKKRW